MRYLTLILATLFVVGFSGCGDELKEGDSCKRHSQCSGGMMCGKDLKCHTKEGERATRKAARGVEKAARLKAAQVKPEDKPDEK